MALRTHLLMLLIISICSSSSAAGVYSFSEDNTVIGMTKTYKIKNDESLIEIARRFDIGFNEITEANPDLDAFIPGAGKSVNIPTSWVLPDVPFGNLIVINLSEMRLYYFFKKKKSMFVTTFPIGIGSEGTDTPEGNFKIVGKQVNPSWYVPASIRKEKPTLPRVVPPGPDNPLGSHALRLSANSVLIHGTNRPYAVGRKASHGCIRMYPEDIPELFRLVPKGFRVSIVRQPLKLGIKNNEIYMEVHNDKNKNLNYYKEAIELLTRKNLLASVSTEKLYHALKEKRGIPVNISN